MNYNLDHCDPLVVRLQEYSLNFQKGGKIVSWPSWRMAGERALHE